MRRRAVARLSLKCCLTSFDSEGSEMRRDDLMKKDMVSEVVLLGSGLVIALSVIIALIAAFMRKGSMP